MNSFCCCCCCYILEPKLYRCEICQKNFAGASGLWYHNKHVHGGGSGGGGGGGGGGTKRPSSGKGSDEYKNGDYELTEKQQSFFNEEQLRAFQNLDAENQRKLKKNRGTNLSRWRRTFDNKQIGGSGGGGGGGGGGTKRPSSGKGSDERGKKRK